MKSVLIIGYGVVGANMGKLFPSCHIHDPEKFTEARDGVRYDIGFVCVPTDSLPDGSADTAIVEQVVREHAERCDVLVIKSTVPPGTTQSLIDEGYSVVMSPEYFGATQHANGVDYGFAVFGGRPSDTARVAELYEQTMPAFFRILRTDATTAELVKYGENAWLAAKVSFCNEMARIADAFGVDYRVWRELWLADPRINPSHTFVYEDAPYYDSHCLNKDIPALIAASKGAGYVPHLLEEVDVYNEWAKRIYRE